MRTLFCLGAAVLVLFNTAPALAVTVADCPQAKRFHGGSASSDSCKSTKFFDDKSFLNPKKRVNRVCLGFAGDIDAKLKAKPDYCMRLASKEWTEALNMKFIKCAGYGEFGEVVWLTRAAAVSKSRAGWQNAVTFAEMCQWKDLGKKFPQ